MGRGCVRAAVRATLDPMADHLASAVLTATPTEGTPDVGPIEEQRAPASSRPGAVLEESVDLGVTGESLTAVDLCS